MRYMRTNMNCVQNKLLHCEQLSRGPKRKECIALGALLLERAMAPGTAGSFGPAEHRVHGSEEPCWGKGPSRASSGTGRVAKLLCLLLAQLWVREHSWPLNNGPYFHCSAESDRDDAVD